MLDDLITAGLKLVICGTAVSNRSAQLRMYYAGPGNKFWRNLFEVGLTAVVLQPQQYRDLLKYGIGLTDIVKGQSGTDQQIDFSQANHNAFISKIQEAQPQILCFNGKKAAQMLLDRPVDYGVQKERIGKTILYVAPSTSGAANGFWDQKYWRALTSLLEERQ